MAMIGATPRTRSSFTACTPRPPTPHTPTAWPGLASAVWKTADHGVETASGMMQATSKSMVSGIWMAHSAGMTVYSAQPPS